MKSKQVRRRAGASQAEPPASAGGFLNQRNEKNPPADAGGSALRQLNPLSFESTFPEVFRDGGFDAIVGNPPYVRQEMISHLKPYFQKRYETFHGVADLYVYFFERYIDLLKDGGEFGIIVANKWLRANYGEPLRAFLKKKQIEEIVDFGDLPVFQGATTYPCIIRARKNAAGTRFHVTEIAGLDFGGSSLSEYVLENQFSVRQAELDDKGWSLTVESSQNLLTKLRATGIPLGKYVDGKIYRGVLTGLNEAFVIDSATRLRLIEEDPRSEELIKPFLAGRDIKRYQSPVADKFLIFMPKGWTRERTGGNPSDSEGVSLPTEDTLPTGRVSAFAGQAWTWLNASYPAIARYLERFAAAAEKRYDKGEFWWELRACDYYDEFEKPKIISPAIVQRASYAFDIGGQVSNDKTAIIPTSDKYLLGVIASRLLDFYLHSIASTKQGGYFEYKPMYLSKLPIRTIDFNNPKEKAMHDRMVGLVDQMIEAKKNLAAARTDRDKQFYERFCEKLDRDIDELVYQLYDITPEERKIIEGAAA